MRRFWLRLHRWLALVLGLPLALVALLGASLVVLKPLDRWLNAELFSVPAGPAAPDLLERTRRQLLAEFGPGASLVLRPVKSLPKRSQKKPDIIVLDEQPETSEGTQHQ